MSGAARRLAVPVLLHALCACESVHGVGSDCPGGRCEDPLEGDACLLADRQVALTVLGYLPNGPAATGYCAPVAVVRGDDGLVDCSLLWRLPAGARCRDFGQARRVDTDGDDRELCAINQLATFDGALADTSGRGWVYDDFSVDEPIDVDRATPDGALIIAESCPVRVGYVELSSRTVPEGAEVELHCATALRLASGASVVPLTPPLDRCAKPAPVARAVGDPCQPQMEPAGGFDAQAIYVQVRATGCESNACLVDGVRGSASADCGFAGTCPSDAARNGDLYCSCRCSGDGASQDDGSICDCPEGFVCEEVLASGPDGVRGGYCVRDG